MTADSQLPLQNAILTALKADATLEGYLSLGSPTAMRVWNETPQDPVYPHVTVGDEGTAQDWDTKTTDGMEQTIHVHVWSRYRGSKEVLEIRKRIVDVLDGADLSLDGHTLVLLRAEFMTVMRDPDGVTRHGVVRFRALTQGN